MTARWTVISVLFVLVLGGVAEADTVRYFRYSTPDRNNDTRVFGELPVAKTNGLGKYVRGTYDASQRLIETAVFIEGVREGYTKIEYDGAEVKRARLAIYGPTGDLKSKWRLEWGKDGRKERSIQYDPAGVVTATITYEHHADHLVVLEKPALAAEFRSTLYFDSSDRLIKRVSSVGPKRTATVHYDPATGNGLKTEHMDDHGRVVGSSTVDYDESGLVIRKTIFEDGAKTGVQRFEKNLMIDEEYFITKSTYKHQIDRKLRRRLSVEYRREGVLICTFVYAYDTSGRIVSTKAMSPDGKVMADYPDSQVRYVNRDGTAQDGDTSVVHVRPFW